MKNAAVMYKHRRWFWVLVCVTVIAGCAGFQIAIGKVKVEYGIAHVLAMETRSAIPIADEVALSLAVVPRRGISAVQSRDGIISITRRR